MVPNDARIVTGQCGWPQTRILDLNSDCLLHILRCLKVDDLAVASDTCRQFRDIGREAFKFEWKNRMIHLSAITKDTRIASTAVLRNFGNQLQRILIYFGEKWNDYFFGMIIEKCSGVHLNEVQISHKVIGQDNVNRFKNKFTTLKSLGLGSTSWADSDPDEYFPTLEAVTFIDTPVEDQRDLQFIIMHPQLKRLSLEYTIRLHKAKSLFKLIDQHLPQLEELEVGCLAGPTSDIKYRPEFFKNLKRLSFLNGIAVEMRYLSISNEKVEELAVKSGTYNHEMADLICQYKEVKKLTIQYVDYLSDYKDLLILNEHLPKLSELEITIHSRNLNHQEIAKFVLGSKQLMILTIEVYPLENILGFKNDLQSKLDITKWVVDCYLSSIRFVIIVSRNY